MLRKLLVWSLPLALAAVTTLAMADQSKDLQEMQKQMTKLDNEASQNLGHDAVFASLSKQLNVPVATLQDQQKSTNFGFGQLFIANSLAAATGKSFDAISQEFKSGKGWGEIANENNLKLGKVVSDLKRANRQVERDRTEQAQANAGGSNNSNRGQSANKGSGTSGDSGSGAANASSRGASQSRGGGMGNARGRH